MPNKFCHSIIALALYGSVAVAAPNPTVASQTAIATQKVKGLDSQFLNYHWVRLVNAPKRQAIWTVRFPDGKTVAGDLIVDLSDRIESHDGDRRHIALIDSTSAARCFISLPDANESTVLDAVGEVKCRGFPTVHYASTNSPLGDAAVAGRNIKLDVFNDQKQKNSLGTLSIDAGTARTTQRRKLALSEVFTKIYDRSLFDVSKFSTWNDQNSGSEVHIIELPPTSTHRVKAIVTQTIGIDTDEPANNPGFSAMRRWHRQNWRFKTTWILDDHGFVTGQPTLLETYTSECSASNLMGCSAPQTYCARVAK